MTKEISIYRIVNRRNGRCYVGQTCKSVAGRFAQHWYEAKKQKTNTLIHKAMRSHGKENFDFEQLLVCAPDMANFYENAAMIANNAHVSKGGYNTASPLDHYRSINSGMSGENHGGSKLTENQVLEIRSRFDLSLNDASIIFGVCRGTIKSIRYGKTWKNVGVIFPASSYKKDNQSGEKHHLCIVSDQVRKQILENKSTPTNKLALKYNLSKHVVLSIRGAQPQIAKMNTIADEVAQTVLDNPDVAHSVLSKQLGISSATISRIKNGHQFKHLSSRATDDKWQIFFAKKAKMSKKELKHGC